MTRPARNSLTRSRTDGSTNLTTRYTRDQRGLVTSVTDPDGNTTAITNDEDGRPVVETDPAVPSPVRLRRGPSDRPARHHHRLRHVRRPDRVFRRRRQHHPL